LTIREVEISCSVISGNPLTAIEDIRILDNLKIDSWHFDVMDGQFVPRFGLHPEYLNMLRNLSPKIIDVHVMTENPEQHFKVIAENGAGIISPHLESLKHPIRALLEISALGCAPGVAVNASTPINNLEPILEYVNQVTLMAINPGIVGHTLIPNIYPRIEELRTLIDRKNLSVSIVVDGGVTFENATLLKSAGANVIVCGAGTLFKKPESIENNYNFLKSTLLTAK
jgi:ribulose-phosphate 3-epimerase